MKLRRVVGAGSCKRSKQSRYSELGVPVVTLVLRNRLDARSTPKLRHHNFEIKGPEAHLDFKGTGLNLGPINICAQPSSNVALQLSRDRTYHYFLVSPSKTSALCDALESTTIRDSCCTPLVVGRHVLKSVTQKSPKP